MGCVLSAEKQELEVLVLEPSCCRELARTWFCARYGACRNVRLGVRHLGAPGQARDGARGMRPGQVGLPGKAQSGGLLAMLRHCRIGSGF